MRAALVMRVAALEAEDSARAAAAMRAFVAELSDAELDTLLAAGSQPSSVWPSGVAANVEPILQRLSRFWAARLLEQSTGGSFR
jgi:hypothetical protein